MDAQDWTGFTPFEPEAAIVPGIVEVPSIKDLRSKEIPTASIYTASPLRRRMELMRAEDSKRPPSVEGDQFYVFQLAKGDEKETITDILEIDPALSGSDASPDVIASITLDSFHLSNKLETKKDSRATLKLTIGRAPDSPSLLETGFWAVTSALNLYNQYKKGPSEPDQLKADLHKAFNNRPIEIAGGLGVLSFEVVKHSEPKWYERVFKFLQSPAGTALTASIGLPGVTQAGVAFIDELIDRLSDNDPEPLFVSDPLKLVFSKRAKQYFTGGQSRVRIGAMNEGFAILARGADYSRIAKANAIYDAMTGKLVGPDMTPQERYTEDLFSDVTYAVLRVRARETKLNALSQL